MAKVTVLGGTGYAGGHIVAAAQRRGHTVTAYSRNAPANPVPGVTYVQGSVLDPKVLDQIFAGADVVLSAVAPRGEIGGKMLQVVTELEKRAASTGKRLGVVGGAASLLIAPGGPKVGDLPSFPEEYKVEAAEMEAVLTFLRSDAAKADWFYLSPPGGFGPFAVGEFTGKYRVGDDVLLVTEDGQSTISGDDFGDALISEVETPKHSRKRFTAGY
jgi:hypothetical protein